MATPDTGEVEPRLAAALAAPPGPASRAELLAALFDARVFAAITATATSEQPSERTGLRSEASAELAVMLLEQDAGERALPIFPSLLALRRWNLAARPIPLTGGQACAAALDERAGAVLVDPMGTAVVLDRTEVEALASGWVPVPGTTLTARLGETEFTALGVPAPKAFVSALQAALEGEGLRSARLLQGPDGIVLGVAAAHLAGPAELAALASRVLARLGHDLPAAGLDLTQVKSHGVGQELLRQRRWSFRRSIDT